MRITKPTRFAALSLLFAFAAACSPVVPTPTPVPPTPTPTVTPNPAGLCANTLIPVKEGASWTYNNNVGTSNLEQFTATITEVRPDGFSVAVSSAGNPTVNQDWTCKPDGLVASDFNPGQGFMGLNVAGIQANLSSANATGVIVPANVQQGAQWPFGIDMAGSLSQGNLSADLKGNIASSMQAVGTESVTVPAGTFNNAVKVQGTSTVTVNASYQGINLPFTSTANLTLWFAPGVGWIKSTVSGNLLGTAFSATTELQSYKLPNQ